MTLKDCKVYLLNAKEQEKLNEFLEEHLKLGRTRLSKSPCTAPFFCKKERLISSTSIGLLTTQ